MADGRAGSGRRADHPAAGGDSRGYPRADLGEVQLRKAAGESPVAVEYQQRFLHLIEHLDRQFELEQVLGELPDDTLIGDRPEPPELRHAQLACRL